VLETGEFHHHALLVRVQVNSKFLPQADQTPIPGQHCKAFFDVHLMVTDPEFWIKVRDSSGTFLIRGWGGV